jgi:predicted amidophosphoribosyltransferase
MARERKAIVELNPRKLRGPWDGGYALDVHTVSSTFLGNDDAGHPRFNTARSPIGELLYRLKYKNDETTIAPLAETVASFLRTRRTLIDAIVPVPPSTARRNQPVTLLAMAISPRIGIPLCIGCLSKVKRTP